MRCLVGGVLAVLLSGLAAHVASEDRAARHQLEDRFLERVALAAEHVSTEVAVVADRQRTVAVRDLSAATMSPATLDQAVASHGLRSAAVLDGAGAVVAASAEAALGTEVAADVVARARAGQVGVTDVLAATSEPVIAFAVPYTSPAGPRVLWATYEVRDTSLTSFLRTASSLPGRVVHLVDARGQVVAGVAPGIGGSFSLQEPELAAAPADERHVVRRGVTHTVADVPVAGTGWRLVASVPREDLVRPLGRVALGPWTLVGGFVVVSVAVMVLLDRLFLQQDHLRRVSATDGLTGLVNRAHADAHLHAIARESARSGDRWAVLMIDVDHFKLLNDRFGHAAGDRALRLLAATLRGNVRAEDLVARWGGEEFVVVLRGVGLADALGAGERLAAAVRALPPDVDLPLTISIGVAAGAATDAEALVRSADLALYRAKAGGRDRVAVDVPGDLRSLDTALVPATP